MPSAATCWPSPLQELLLQATLLEGDAARQAWEQWRAGVDLDRIDPHSYSILAPLSSRLGAIDEPIAALLKGVRRQAWTANQRLLKSAATALRVLDAAGIPLLLLKGAALVVGYYGDPGLRPLAAVNVMIPVERVRDAIALAEKQAWTPVHHDARRTPTDSFLRVRSAVELRRRDGMSLMLHWHVMPEAARAGLDEAFLHSARTAELSGLAVRILAPTDQLLHVMGDGVRLGAESMLCWPIDALAVMRSPETRIDWVRVITMAQRLRVVLSVSAALVYLRDRLAAPIPAEIVAQLSALPATRADRLDYRFRTTAHDYGAVNMTRRLWLLHRRLSESSDTISLLASFPKFLQHYYELDSLRRLPTHLAARVLRRMPGGRAS